jgi:hypothetical protein
MAAMAALGLSGRAALAAAGPQLEADEYTRYELLAPESSRFHILYEVTATTPGAGFFFNPIRKGSAASGEAVYDRASGRRLEHTVVSGAEAARDGLGDADPATSYIRIRLPRPVPATGGVRLLIEKTYLDAKSYFREGADRIVFTRSLGIRRNAIVLPAGYELLACNVPAQVLSEPGGRLTVSFFHAAPGPAELTLRARKLPSGPAPAQAALQPPSQPPAAQNSPPAAATGASAPASQSSSPQASPHRPAAQTSQPAAVTQAPGVASQSQTAPASSPAPTPASPPPPRPLGERGAERLVERAHQDREIVYFLRQPESHAFDLYHDYTESRPGTDRYLNVVRKGSRATEPSARNLDTGEPLAVETLRGEAIKRAHLDVGEEAGADTEVVIARFPAVRAGESLRLRIAETYTDAASYGTRGDDLVFDRGFGRPRNSVVLPAGWYLTASSIPATVAETPDGRIRLDFVNPRPDEIAVLLEAKRRPAESRR